MRISRVKLSNVVTFKKEMQISFIQQSIMLKHTLHIKTVCIYMYTKNKGKRCKFSYIRTANKITKYSSSFNCCFNIILLYEHDNNSSVYELTKTMYDAVKRQASSYMHRIFKMLYCSCAIYYLHLNHNRLLGLGYIALKHLYT